MNSSSDLISSKHFDFTEGDRLYFQSRYPEAHQAYQVFLEHVSTSSEISSPELASLYYKLGLSSFKLAKFSEAHCFFDKALDITKTLENKVLEIARILNGDAEAYTREAKFSEAEERITTAIEMIKSNYEEEHEEMIACYNRLAYLSEQKEQYESVVEYTNKAVQLSLKLNLGPNADIATTHFRSANAYWYEGETTKASSEIQKCLSVRQQIYGNEHVDIALCYRILGDIDNYEDRLPEALQHYEKGLSMLTRLLGDNNIEHGDFYCNIGRVYFKQEDHAKSLEFQQKALENEQRFLPEDHHYLAYTYGDFGDVYKEQSKHEEAIEAYDWAIKQFSKKLGEDHWRIALFLESKAEVYDEQERYSEAIKLVKKQLGIQIRNYGKENSRLVDTYDQLAYLYYQDSKYKKVLVTYLKSLRINSLRLKERLVEAAFNFENISNLFEVLEDLNSRESLGKKAKISYEKVNGINHVFTTACVEALEETQRRKCLQDLNHNFNI